MMDGTLEFSFLRTGSRQYKIFRQLLLHDLEAV